MKRTLFLLLLCTTALPWSLDPSRARAEGPGPLRVVASLTDLGEIARAVGGDEVSVSVIAPGVSDPHFVDPRPSYVVRMRSADALLVNGLELEQGWIPPLLAGARNPAIRPGAAGYVDCSSSVPLLERATGTVTREDGDVHPLGNPHYLTDPLNHKLVAETIARAFTRLRPQAAAAFEARLRGFRLRVDEAMFGAALVSLVGGSKLDRLARSGRLRDFLNQSSQGEALTARLGGWLGKMAPLAGRRIAAYHRSFSYFHQRFELSVVDYVERKPGIQPGPAALAEVIAHMREQGARLLLTHPFYDAKIARLVADRAGATVVELPLHCGGVAGSDDTFAFFDLVTTRLLRAAESAP